MAQGQPMGVSTRLYGSHCHLNAWGKILCAVYGYLRENPFTITFFDVVAICCGLVAVICGGPVAVLCGGLVAVICGGPYPAVVSGKMGVPIIVAVFCGGPIFVVVFCGGPLPISRIFLLFLYNYILNSLYFLLYVLYLILKFLQRVGVLRKTLNFHKMKCA